jgi:hypothetical protein
LQVAVIEPEVMVDTDLQFLMTRSLAKKRTDPAVETVTVIGFKTPKVSFAGKATAGVLACAVVLVRREPNTVNEIAM